MSRFIPRALLAVAISAPLLIGLPGCDSDSSSSAGSGGLTVTPSLGLVRNATVVVKDALGATVGTGSTNNDGIATFTAVGSGPFVIEVTGDADATYFDEKLGAFVDFTSGTLHALVPSGSTSVAVTGLTELAWSLWNSSDAPLSDANIVLANDALLEFIAPSAPAGFDDLLSSPTLLAATPAAGTLASSGANFHALLLAALARLGSGSTPALSVITQLSQDLSDGDIDGNDLSGAIAGLLYDHTLLGSDLAAEVDAIATAWGNAALQSVAGGHTAGTLAAPEWNGVYAPVLITGLSAASGAVGSNITITGSGFDADPFHMQVLFFSAVPAVIVSASPTELVVTVPDGAATGPVYVSHELSGFSDTTDSDFTVTGSGGGDNNVGDSWTARAAPAIYTLSGIAWGNDLFVATGNGKTITTSANGISWTPRTGPDANWFSGYAVTFDGTRFILVGDSTPSTPPMIATSTDGITWARQTWTHDGEGALVDVTAAGGKITAVGANGKVVSSTDGGANWTTETQSVASLLKAVASSGTVRVAIGGTNQIIVDSGSGWTSVAGITGFAGKDVAWTGTQFVAVGGDSANFGANSVVMTSSDGSTWTRHALTTDEASAGYSLLSVTVLGTTVYASGTNNGTGHHIVSSTDGASWTLEYQGTVASGQGQLAAIAASADAIVAVGGNGSVTSP